MATPEFSFLAREPIGLPAIALNEQSGTYNRCPAMSTIGPTDVFVSLQGDYGPLTHVAFPGMLGLKSAPGVEGKTGWLRRVVMR